MNRLPAMRDAGVSVSVDTLSRPLLESGDVARPDRHSPVTGATSNPAIFATAITNIEANS